MSTRGMGGSSPSRRLVIDGSVRHPSNSCGNRSSQEERTNEAELTINADEIAAALKRTSRRSRPR
jgi:hypothetical protein